jgi:hypothetical protein
MRSRYRLAVSVALVALAAVALASGTIGPVGVQDARANHPCDTTDYWNVSWCYYHANQGRTKVRECCTTSQSAYNTTEGWCIRFLHATGGGGWISAPHVCSGESWTFYNVTSTDRIGWLPLARPAERLDQLSTRAHLGGEARDT